ncbi:MAG: M23 family metallopeptidase [Bacteroidales bacterium]|jgi:murein DD-endopeptidase MepM/ murein hydrolase activator NlpD|nr:M23 family metallopeptidase [Bacteroidales bacterium]
MGRKYVLDLIDLQYKQVKLAWKERIWKLFLWFLASVIVTLIYGTLIQKLFGSPKEAVLYQELENMKLQYSMLDRQIDESLEVLNNLSYSDDNRYRLILDMDTVPGSIRSSGVGGVNRYEELEGYEYTGLMVSMRKKVDAIRNRSTVQFESFKAVSERTAEWKREMEYLPMISPVSVSIRRGDGVKFREVHPVLGTPQWHHGQDFSAPYGTEVYATGSGKVIEAGWSQSGFGTFVVIDHGYGYQTTYGHLSAVKVSVGMNVKRGDLIALSGNTGTSTGPHLHYQIDLYGQHRNPLYYFNDDLTEDEYFEMIETLSSRLKFR